MRVEEHRNRQNSMSNETFSRLLIGSVAMSRVGIGCSDTEKQSGGRKSGQSQTSPAGYKATRRRRNSMLEDWLFIVDGNGIYGGRRKKTEVEFQLLHSSTTYLYLCR
ncbi:hypothetical protein RUM44_000259 [Polyplax serrata]|uniref:Uncharacterized protein n=1 Tax=Polyplax serrata TaxID=468196 RepID=A0ABR1B5N1_POLSC